VLRSFNDVLALWTPKQFSRVMGLSYSTAVAMYQRESISTKHWLKVIELTTARGEVLTAEMLLHFRERIAVKADQRIAVQSRGRAHRRTKSQTLSLPVS
jgi:hypothetical protein